MLTVNKKLAEILKKQCTNIFPIVAPLKTTFPYIVYGRSGTNPLYTKFGYDSSTAIFDISVISDKYQSLFDLVDKLLTDMTKNKDIQITDVSESYGEEAFIYTITIQIN